MPGARAAAFVPWPKLVLLPLLVLLFHRTRPQGEFWSELVSGSLPPRSCLKAHILRGAAQVCEMND